VCFSDHNLRPHRFTDDLCCYHGVFVIFRITAYSHNPLSFFFFSFCQQIGYNLLWRSIEYEVKPLCVANNISVLAYSPLQQGLLTGKFGTLDDIPEGRRRGKLFNNMG
jgi:aryl-alcohol dehydrogenase-like predicted oxidoreductase